MDEHGGGRDDCMDQKAGDVTGLLFQEPAMRDALLQAVRDAHRLHLYTKRLVLCCSTSTIGFDRARDLDPMHLAATALAIALEKWARGTPAGALRDQCRQRQPEEWPTEIEDYPSPT